jgi:hypothetical protein
VVFNPGNKPYLGREALLIFDKEIPFSLWVSSHIAAHTRSNLGRLTDLQTAACQIVPQGINLALSIRELKGPVCRTRSNAASDRESGRRRPA